MILKRRLMKRHPRIGQILFDWRESSKKPFKFTQSFSKFRNYIYEENLMTQIDSNLEFRQYSLIFL